MEVKRGIPVSPGVAIGPALVLDTEGVRIPQRTVEVGLLNGEAERVRAAVAAAVREVRESERTVSDKLGPQYGAIIGNHAIILEDPEFAREVEELIRGHHFAAEYAVSRTIRGYVKRIERQLGPDHPFARTADLYDIERRLLAQLLGQRRETLQQLQDPVIVIAHDLTPSETAALDPSKVHAFATEAGGRTSHTAILAGALEIPAVVGLGKFLTDVSGGDMVIVDGDEGLLVIDPDPATLARYQETRRTILLAQAGRNGELRDLPPETRDGVEVALLGNIEFPTEAAHCLDRGAAGVGLYRTEFLYVGHATDPTEEEHFEAYTAVLRAIGPNLPMVIRTLDLGADKFNTRATTDIPERNPFLGLRSVRFCLRNLTLFKTQMRAILRASAFGNVWVMFPMVSTLLELRQCKMILAEVKEDLEEAGVPFNPDLPVGTMIEVPSAALMADQLAREVQFFSIGTNDLVQYTLAADRTNENVATLYSPADPAVLRLIRSVVDAADSRGIHVNVCGEMSGDPTFTALLVGLGLRQLSVTPHNIPAVKRAVRALTVPEAVEIAREAMKLETARDVTNYLREQYRRLVPEAAAPEQ